MRLFFFLIFLSPMVLAKMAPPFQGDLVGGGRISLGQHLKPNRGLLLCFWATWCAPCLEELKVLSEKIGSDRSVALDVLTVNVDASETSGDVRPTLRLYQINFPVILDAKHEIFAKYHETKTLPFSVLILHGGSIARTFHGFHGSMFAEVKSILASNSSNENKGL